MSADPTSADGGAPEAIYLRPADYDLEHVGDTADVDFFVDRVSRLKPRRVLELASGTGRVTVPLAEAGAAHGFDVAGLEVVPEMLEAARERAASDASPEARARLRFVEGDIRTWGEGESPFDVILTPCSSVTHLLTLEDQLAAWRRAFANLAPGGRFLVDVAVPDLTAFADSLRRPPREPVEVDLDTYDEATRTRLIRYRTTHYRAHEQRALVRYLYDKFVGDRPAERAVSDFESHVYYPRELTLLFLHTGFEIEAEYGDYRGRPPGPYSPQRIVTGRKPG